MQTILKRAAIRNNVHETFLEFIGIQDEADTIGKLIFHYNICDPLHPRYRSTITYFRNA